MTDFSDIKCLCRTCAAAFRDPARPRAGAPCPSCGGRRFAVHDELGALAIAHIDCDAFYAAVEKRDAPDLRDRPVIVGGGRRGVVTTACYIARTYGVRSAMPMFKALAACPDAVVIRPDFAKYTAVSRAIRALFEELTPLVEPVSIDEAFVDLSGTARIHGAPPAVMLARLQNAIADRLGVTVSVGLSHNKFLAKLASDMDKPTGFSVIGRTETITVLAPLAVSRIAGVGKALEARLKADGIATIGDLQARAPTDLMRHYGVMGQRLARLARGEDTRPVTPHRAVKSVSAETTFYEDLASAADLFDKLWPLCEKVSRRMKEKSLAGRTVTLKLKTADFRTVTRQTRLDEASNLARTAFEAVRPLLAALAEPGVHYRLIGVGYSDLEDACVRAQPRLFERPEDRWARQETAVDHIRARYGEASIATGRILKKGTPET